MSYLAACVLAVSLVSADAEGQKAFQSWGNLAVGGVWTGTLQGVEQEHTYRWFANKKFLEFTAKEKGSPEIRDVSVIGIDPKSGKMTWWDFMEDGSLAQETQSLLKDGVWAVSAHYEDSSGKHTWTAVVSKLGEDQVRLEGERVTNGKSEGKQTTVWTCKR